MAFPLLFFVFAFAFSPSPLVGSKIRLHSLSQIRTCTYEGALLGVRAKADLNLSTRQAILELSGWPVGGKITGLATFAHKGEENQGGVSLSPDLDRMLRQRFVSIAQARHVEEDDTVVVSLNLPIVGAKSVVMHRVLKK